MVLTILSYHTAAGGTPGSVAFFAVRPGGNPTEQILLGRGVSPDIVGPGDEGNVTFCGKVLPRDRPPAPALEGAQWEVRVFTEDKDVDATVCVDWVLEPFPDTDERDSETI